MNGSLKAPAPLDRGATLADQVTDLLRDRVTGGHWSVGDMLPSEAGLAQEMQVSRTVIRESIARLRAEGLLNSQQGRGLFVSSDRPRMGFAIDQQDVESLKKLAQILELRLGIEVEAAAFAALRGTAESHAAIAKAADAYGEASRGDKSDVDAGVSTDLRFHRAVCEATSNDYFVSLFNYLGASLRETMLAGRLQAIRRASQSRDAVMEHHAIAVAIATGDPSHARDAMRVHLERSGARLLGQLRPETFG